MAFVTGSLLIDAPASALNNLGNIEGEREDNTVGVKMIKVRTGQGTEYYPYVSAQAFRYWLRMTLEERIASWQAAPMYREEKIAYTDANPLLFWDDDLFGYMRAPSKKETAKARREADPSRQGETETTDTITRVSPFRVSTLVSIAPVTPTSDFGTMSRHEGNPVPHEHQFYRATLKGLFSLNLHACGTFSYRNKTGFRNLDSVREKLAQDTSGIEHLETEKAYRLPVQQRIERIQSLFEGMSQLEGGAKQTLHYTDVSPVLVFMAVTRGGNNIFGHVVGIDKHGKPMLKTEALHEALTVFADTLLSPVYVGWVRGYQDEARAQFEAFVEEYQKSSGIRIHISHPRDAFKAMVEAFAQEDHATWLQ
ncbi:MAG: type I-B CRISPR-associated protein Cas7/Cst2/DevR [Chloroflexaceae bacterium]|nr:type I-B CRISPR-associated protein Cas7/Cst2/DevR [Chloroflexaceae bacterium]